MPIDHRARATRSRLRLVAAGSCLALAHCVASEPPAVDIELGVSPTPATVGEARLIVTLGGLPDNVAPQVAIVGTGPHDSEGDPSERPVRWAQRTPSGGYVVPAFPFETPGEWSLTVRVLLPDGHRVDRSFPVRVVGPLEEPGAG